MCAGAKGHRNLSSSREGALEPACMMAERLVLDKKVKRSGFSSDGFRSRRLEVSCVDSVRLC